MKTSIISIGHVSHKATVAFETYEEATNAWLLLASMSIPAALLSGADGWMPNTKTTAWSKPTGLNWNIPDITLIETPVGYNIESAAMRCEVCATKDGVWKVVAELISEYIDRVESDCWEVA